MLQDLLDYSQINNNKFRQNIEEFDIKQSIDEIIQIQKFKAQMKGIELKANFEDVEQALVRHD